MQRMGLQPAPPLYSRQIVQGKRSVDTGQCRRLGRDRPVRTHDQKVVFLRWGKQARRDERSRLSTVA